MKRIVVENVWKKFSIGYTGRQRALSKFISMFSGREPKKEFWAVKGVSMTAEAGEILGLIGENGSGKSTLLRLIAGIYAKDKGKIETDGRIISLINLNIGLKDRLTMRDNIYMCCSLFGLGKRMVDERFNAIVEFTELEEYVNTKLYQFSAGMAQRLAFSIAVHCNPEILLLDEVFEIGDESFKKKSTERIEGLVGEGATVVLVSHDLPLIERHCSRVAWMDRGVVVREGNSTRIVEEYGRHEKKG